MKKETLKKWKSTRVRIKREYLVEDKQLNYDKSTYDEESNELIEEVYDKWATINMDNGFEGCVIIPNGKDLSTAVFKVRAEIYGVDLYGKPSEIKLCDLPEPSHQIIIEECGGWPYIWESKYFEVVCMDWVVDEEYK